MTTEIDEVLKADSFTSQIYQGTFALDTLPKLRPSGLYIMNLDVSTESGSHWTLIKVHKENAIVTYFDSLGRPPPIEIIPQLTKEKNIVKYADVAVQSSLSQACGYHVLFVAFLLARGSNLKEILLDIYYALERQYLRNDFLSMEVISTLTKLRKRPIIDWENFFPKEKK